MKLVVAASLLLSAASVRAAPLVVEVGPGVTVDWTRGLVSARAVGPADRNAPSPAVARVAARRAAVIAARAKLLAAVSALPAVGGTLGKVGPAARIAAEIERAPIVDESYGTDGSVRVTVAVGTEALRQTIAGPRPAPRDEAPAEIWIVLAGDRAIAPQLDYAIGTWHGALRWTTTAPAAAHTLHVTKVSASGVEVDGPLPPAGAAVVVVVPPSP